MPSSRIFLVRRVIPDQAAQRHGPRAEVAIHAVGAPERRERDRQSQGCLEHIEDTAPDGTQYQTEFLALWDGKSHGDIRVCGDISAKPQKRLLGVLPIFNSNVTDSFTMSPDGRFVGEYEKPEVT